LDLDELHDEALDGVLKLRCHPVGLPQGEGAGARADAERGCHFCPARPGQEGCPRPKRYCEAPLAEWTGWWVNLQQRILCLCLTHHPASLSGCFAIFLDVARSAPPGQEGQVACPVALMV